jgi:hypothetical protein
VGKGDLIRDMNINGVLVPKNTTCNCNQWPHQQSESLFEWNNTNYDGSPSVWSAALALYPSEHQGRDYFDLGINILAGKIPAQVTSAYPASVNGGSAYTQDFIYPHPLQGAGNPTPNSHPYPDSNALMFIITIGLRHRRRMVAVVYSLSAEHLLRSNPLCRQI